MYLLLDVKEFDFRQFSWGLAPGVGLKCISRTRVTLTQISAGNTVPGFAQSPKYDDAKKSGNDERFIHPGS